MTQQARQRPREVVEEALSVTGEDLPSVPYEEYYNCGWPIVVRTVNIGFQYEVLTKGLEADWSRSGIETSTDEDSDGGGNPLVDSIDQQLNEQARKILGVKECNDRRAQQKQNDDPSVGAGAGTGIVQIESGQGSYDEAVGQCTSFQLQDIDTVCTPMKGSATIIYDPERTDATQASNVVMDAMTEATEMGSESRGDSSLLTENIVGMQMIAMTDVEVDDVLYTDAFSGDETGTANENDAGAVAVGVAGDDFDATPRGEMAGIGNGGMGGGAIAGMVIGLLVAVGLLIVATIVMRKRRRDNKAHRREDDREDAHQSKTSIGECMRDDLGLYHNSTV